jgi:hypothetical protein
MPEAGALALALADNLERPVNPAETALVWRKLVETLGIAEAEKLAGFLGLAQAPKLRGRNFEAASLPPRGLKALADGSLDLSAAARLSHWDEADREAVLDLFETFKPSLSSRRLWLDWLEDLTRREGPRPALILAELGLQALPSGAAAGDLIFRRRHPELAKMRQKRADRLRALGLPPAARLSLDPDFEDLSFSLTLTFSGPDDFQSLAELVGALPHRPDFQALLSDD